MNNFKPFLIGVMVALFISSAIYIVQNINLTKQLNRNVEAINEQTKEIKRVVEHEANLTNCLLAAHDVEVINEQTKVDCRKLADDIDKL